MTGFYIGVPIDPSVLTTPARTTHNGPGQPPASAEEWWRRIQDDSRHRQLTRRSPSIVALCSPPASLTTCSSKSPHTITFSTTASPAPRSLASEDLIVWGWLFMRSRLSLPRGAVWRAWSSPRGSGYCGYRWATVRRAKRTEGKGKRSRGRRW